MVTLTLDMGPFQLSEDRIMIDLDPTNNPKYWRMFCMRLKSRTISNVIEAWTTKASWSKIMMKKKDFT